MKMSKFMDEAFVMSFGRKWDDFKDWDICETELVD